MNRSIQRGSIPNPAVDVTAPRWLFEGRRERVEREGREGGSLFVPEVTSEGELDPLHSDPASKDPSRPIIMP